MQWFRGAGGKNVPLAAMFKIDAHDSQHDGAGFRYTAMLFLEDIITTLELRTKLGIHLAGGGSVHELIDASVSDGVSRTCQPLIDFL